MVRRHVLVPYPYAAYLRVYEPLAAFTGADRVRWEAYAADSGRAVARADRLVAEHRSALAAVLAVPPRPVPSEEDHEAFVLRVDGMPHVCPVQTRLRSWVALGQFREGLPDALLHAFVPPAALARADADHARWGGAELGSALRILTATWSVPLPWFVPFAAADRVEPPASGAEPAPVVYRTRMSGARRRAARALRTLRAHLGELDMVDEVEQLSRWLEEFHPRSWLELDYAGLARLLGPAGVAADTSVADVATALVAVAAGEQEAAWTAYRRVADRWVAVAALEHAN